MTITLRRRGKTRNRQRLVHPLVIVGRQLVASEQRKLARRKPTDGEAHVLADREIGEEVGDLEGPADAAARPQVRGRLCEVLSLDDDAPLGRDGHARNGVEQRRLAGPVRADDGAPFAVLERKADAIDGAQGAELHNHVLKPQHRT